MFRLNFQEFPLPRKLNLYGLKRTNTHTHKLAAIKVYYSSGREHLAIVFNMPTQLLINSKLFLQNLNGLNASATTLYVLPEFMARKQRQD